MNKKSDFVEMSSFKGSFNRGRAGKEIKVRCIDE